MRQSLQSYHGYILQANRMNSNATWNMPPITFEMERYSKNKYAIIAKSYFIINQNKYPKPGNKTMLTNCKVNHSIISRVNIYI